MSAPGWPVRLESQGVVVRSLRSDDVRTWREVRSANQDWLRPWDATVPPGSAPRPPSYRAVVRSQLRQARQGRLLPCVVEVDGRFAGQVTVSNITRGSAQWGSLGYWLARDAAGRGVMPRAVAMVIDHCFGPVGLHRIEICIRPENTNSLRVVEKLGLAQVGMAPRFLHIDGAWRDHRIYAITTEECPDGVESRLTNHQSHE